MLQQTVHTLCRLNMLNKLDTGHLVRNLGHLGAGHPRQIDSKHCPDFKVLYSWVKLSDRGQPALERVAWCTGSRCNGEVSKIRQRRAAHWYRGSIGRQGTYCCWCGSVTGVRICTLFAQKKTSLGHPLKKVSRIS